MYYWHLFILIEIGRILKKITIKRHIPSFLILEQFLLSLSQNSTETYVYKDGTKLKEKATKQGGLKKLWISKEDLEEGGEPAADSFERGDLKSDGENEVHACEECPEVYIL